MLAKNPNKKLPQHIVQRGGVYQYVRRVPNDVREHPDWTGKDLIRRSLKTSDLRIAIADAAIINGEIEKAFRKCIAELRAASMPQHFDYMPDDRIRDLVQRALINAGHGLGIDGEGKADLVSSITGRHNISVGESVITRIKQIAYQEAVTHEIRELSGRNPDTSSLIFAQGVKDTYAPAVADTKVEKIVTFDELWTEFQADPGRKKGLDYTGYTTVIELVREICGGNRNVKLITRDEMKRVRAALISMPTYAKNAARRPEYEGWTYEKIADDVRERLDDGEEIDVIKPDVIKKYLGNIGRLFTFGVNEGYMPSSPAAGLTVPTSGEQKRFPFTREQLQVMFPAAFRPVTDVDWMMFLSLTHGFRGNELAQLEVNDIVMRHGVWSISVSPYSLDDNGEPIQGSMERNKKVKTKSGMRILPIHQIAVDLGFVDHVKRRKESGEEQVFVAKKWGKRASHYDSVRGDIEEHMSRLGVWTADRKFHSFRHTFRDACRDALIETAYVREMGGWSRGGSDAVYGSGTSPSVLKPMIDSIRYEIPIFKGR